MIPTHNVLQLHLLIGAQSGTKRRFALKRASVSIAVHFL